MDTRVIKNGDKMTYPYYYPTYASYAEERIPIDCLSARISPQPKQNLNLLIYQLPR